MTISRLGSDFIPRGRVWGVLRSGSDCRKLGLFRSESSRIRSQPDLRVSLLTDISKPWRARYQEHVGREDCPFHCEKMLLDFWIDRLKVGQVNRFSLRCSKLILFGLQD